MRIAIPVAVFVWLVVRLDGQSPQDVVLKAMKDEIARTRALRIVDAPPYFVEYSIDDADIYSASASLGALIADRHIRLRQPRVRIRVGDAKLDNSNHIASDSSRAARYDPANFPIDDSYDALRIGFWLATDRSYKQALEALARKKASLKNVNQTELLGDLGPAPAVSMILPAARVPIASEPWKARIKGLSAGFNGFAGVFRSEVELGMSQTISYMVNSEGSEFRIPDHLVTLRVRASAIAADGSPIRDFVEFHASDPNRLPPEAELQKAVREVATNVEALAKAPVGEGYSGPVLFEAAAAGQLIAEMLGRHLAVVRRPVSDPDRPLNIPAGEFEGRLGSRILPEWVDIVDDATQKEYRAKPLLGYYPIDIEGVVPKPLSLVEKGVLKTYYATRQPVAGVDGSNGHARIPGRLGNNTALAANIFVKAEQTVAAADIRKKLMELGKQRGKPFVYVVRKMDFPSTASIEELRRIGGGLSGRAISVPLLLIRVHADGREELVRGVRFRGLNSRALKDIIAASDEPALFHYLENGGPFSHVDAGGYVAGTSVLAPALLFDDLELERIPGELPRPPLVPPPPLVSAK